MRHLERQCLIFAAMLVLGLGGSFVALDLVGRFGVPMVLLMSAGWTVAAIGAILLVMRLPLLRGRANILAGRDIVGRWRVTPAEWEAFLAFDAARSQLGKRYRNDFKPLPETPAEGIEIVFGPGSVLIGDSYHVLRRWGLPALIAADFLPGAAAGAPDCLEFTLLYGGGRTGPPVSISLRVPIARGAAAAGQAVYAYYRERTAWNRRRPASPAAG